MSEFTLPFKRHNHRVLTCENARKQELLKHLIEQYGDQKTLIISSDNTTTTEVEGKSITLSNDAALAKMNKRKWDILISFDLPEDPADYIKRLEHAKEMALIIADEKKEKELLYLIEALLGRTITREIISGFEEKITVIRSEAAKPKHRPAGSEKRTEAKKPFEKKVWDKVKPGKSPDKKDYKKSKSKSATGSDDYRNKEVSGHKSLRKPRIIKVPSKAPKKD